MDRTMSESNISTVNSTLPGMEARWFVVVPTFYSDRKDPRYVLALETCQQAFVKEIRMIVVDASPSQMIRDGLEQAGRGWVTVVQQTSQGKKGAALREGIRMAATLLQQETKDDRPCIIAFQEPEKFEMMYHWADSIRHMVETQSDVCCIRRNDHEFQRTYPIEQYHSEQFANLFLDSLGQTIGMPSLDWTSGPVAFGVSMANQWLECDGEIWDAQLLPIIDCFLQAAKVTSFEVPYEHPRQMKEQEESNPVFMEKRLHQLNFLNETVGQKLRTVAKSISKRRTCDK